MEILWVKAGGLLPLNMGGRTRSYNILRWLAQKHAVTIFTFYAAHENDQHDSLKQYFADVHAVPLEIPLKGSFFDYFSYVRNLFSLRPYSMAKYYRRRLSEQITSLCKSRQFDFIISDFLHAAPVIPWSFPCTKVFFSHNVETLIWKRHFRIATNPLWKAVCWREYKLMSRAERKYMREADCVLTVSEADKEVFARFIDPQKMTVIPTGVETEYFKPAPDEPSGRNLVFTGSMDWLANEDAMLYFVKEILPLVEKQVPNVSLWIVGRSPSQRVRELGSQHKNVHVTGTVDDVRPYIQQGTVYVVPIRVGSGTRLKIFEAMSMGKAIVSTPVGAEGLPVTHGKDIVLAESPEDFAQSVITLLRDPERRKTLGVAARSLVESRYSWSVVGKIFEEAMMRSRNRGDVEV
jgi:sugar transferase (PEP-CTERM/EpsH1 system associated)